MKNILLIDKKEGQTPLEAMDVFRLKNKKYKDVKMTYAGRLDPMASGLLVVLVGDEVHNKDKYLGLSKEYVFDVLFGFDTDSYDILGKIKRSKLVKNIEISDFEKKIKTNLKFFKGKFIQKYPVYSSRTVNGRPLFEYARKGVKLIPPEREVHVRSLVFKKIEVIDAESLLKNIQKRVSRVQGDFRQNEILKVWEKKLVKNKNHFFVANFHIKCESGTYVRAIAHDLGEKVGVPALAFSIKRTKIGKWSNISS
ncbi:MAG: hypothetical protein KBC06_02085 [Candidatus Pacebacteria bacterium]|nr:hypothetical protein [Candidatus Paceibacterota bacterium]